MVNLSFRPVSILLSAGLCFLMFWSIACVGPAKPPLKVDGMLTERAIQKYDQQEVMVFTGIPVRGGQLYLSYCAGCHSMDGQDTRLGPSFLNLIERSQQIITSSPYSGLAITSKGYIEESILLPNKFLVAGYSKNSMPQYENLLSGQDIADIVAFIINLD